MSEHHHSEHDHNHEHEHEHDHAHGHGHHHAALANGSIDRRIGIAVALNVGFVVVEALYGWRSNSIALIADAGHNLSDVLGLLAAWGAMALARRPAGGRFTYGLGRSSVLAALGNALLLLVACGAIAWEAIGRFYAAPAVAANTVMWVAAAGIVINGVSAIMLHSGRKTDMNMRAAFMHMLGDAAISAGVVLSGFAILATGAGWIDPTVSLLIVLVILWGTWGLLRDSLNLSLDGVPAGVDSVAIKQFLATQNGVVEVHDLHIWALSTTSVALTAHLVVPAGDTDDALLDSLTPHLKRRFKIAHATLQIERGICDHACQIVQSAT